MAIPNFCLLLIPITLLQIPVSSFAANRCAGLFQAPVVAGPLNSDVTSPRAGASLSQAQRLLVALETIPEQQRSQLFQSLTPDKLAEVGSQLRQGNVPKELEAQLMANPGLEIFYRDLAEFSDSFPGLMGQPTAQATVFQILRSVVSLEAKPHATHPRLLESQSVAPRLRRTVDHSLENLIRQATLEYEGRNFQRSGWNLLWYKIRRFISPSYNRVVGLMNTGRFYQNQLERLRVVDALVIRNVISEFRSLRLTQNEFEASTQLVLDSPKEIDQIEAALKEVFGDQFANGRAVEIGQFDLIKAHKKMRELPFAGIRDSFDAANINSLKSMNEILNVSRERLGQPRRSTHEFEANELRIYFEAYERRVSRWRELYTAVTDQQSNESYTVESRQTRQVATGRDDKGHTIYETETYYVNETVYPTFEQILSGSYPQGDRFVWGLESVKNGAEKMVAQESRSRAVLEEAQNFLQTVLGGYNEAAIMGKNRDEFLHGMTEWIQKINQAAKTQLAYQQMSDVQILAQYPKDDVQNFRQRSQWAHDRLHNLQDVFATTHALLVRKESQLTLAFENQDLNLWLNTLRTHRKTNYSIKAVGAGSTIGAGLSYVAFHESPEFKLWLTQWAPDIANLFQMITN
jgi:hypothetical protein